MDDSCPQPTPMNAAEQAHYNGIIAKLSQIIDSKEQMDFLLPPAKCTRSQTQARLNAPKAQKAQKASSSSINPKAVFRREEVKSKEPSEPPKEETPS